MNESEAKTHKTETIGCTVMFVTAVLAVVAICFIAAWGASR